MASTTTVQHGSTELHHHHHQNAVTLHHLGSLTQLKADGDLYAYTVSGDNSDGIILYEYSNSTQGNDAMDFLLDDENGNGIGSSSSHESITNLLDEGLGTSLDGTDEIPTTSSSHSTLGRNDSGVFSSDETSTVGLNPSAAQSSSSLPTIISGTTATTTCESSSSMLPEVRSIEDTTGIKKQRAKNTSPNRQGPQRCAVCGKTFSNASALTKHKLTHSDERKHACNMCGKAFKRQDHLNGHMLTHRNKKPFECSVKGCGKSYCDARSLRRHVESRHGHENLNTSPPITHQDSNEYKHPAERNNNNVERAHPKSKKKTKSDTAANGNPRNTTNPEEQRNTTTSLLSPPTSESSHCVVSTTGANPSTEILNKMESHPKNSEMNTGNKYVMVKLKDKIMMATPSSSVNNDNPETLFLRNANNNNILISPETIATILSNAIVHETTKLTNDLLKVTIPPPSNPPLSNNTSQLHQLLTQRPSSLTTQPSPSTPSMNDLPPGASNNKQQTKNTSSPPYNWATNENEELTKYSSVLTSRDLAIGSDVKSPTGINFSSPESSGILPNTPTTVPTATSPPALTTRKPITSGTSTTSPALLKEQLELIHQIIQQAQEECISAPNRPKTFKGKKTKSTSGSNLNNSFFSPTATGKSTKLESFEDFGKFGTGDDKPVECTICYRRFKNTPALNGHMRLHGGYFKGGKESDGKRKDSANGTAKDTGNTPLQTASVSIRALIEEKIIQKRNTSQGVDSGKVDSPLQGNSPLSYNSRRGSESLPEESRSPVTSEVPISPPVTTFTTSSATNVRTPETHSTLDEETDENFQFIYSQEDQDTVSEYLLKDLEEEVFNKVSSICPESFLDGIIDESILSGGNGSEDLVGSGWNWGTNHGVSRLNSLFTGSASITTTTTTTEDSSPCQFNKMNENESGGENPSYPPLPPLEQNIFYMSPTPKSPSLKDSQDSLSFIYPTPPASLESHPSLQSPLFPFVSSNSSNSVVTPSSLGTPTQLYGYDTLTCSTTNNNSIVNMMEMDGSGTMDCKLFSSPSSKTVDEIVLSLGEAIKRDVNSLISITKNFSETGATTTAGGASEDVVIKMEENGSSSIISSSSSSESMHFPTPSSSPSNATSSIDDSAVKELKVNEPSQMEAPLGSTSKSLCERLDVFLNPNSVPGASGSPCMKQSPKRKQVRNTFASNLRHQTTGSSSHFTPYPILSPVRSAPGLYWTFSNKLSHVDDSKRERPRINVGLNFQASNLPTTLSKKNQRKRKASSSIVLDEDIASGDDDARASTVNITNGESLYEDILWDSSVMENCSTDEVDKYLEFACCSAVPGGGRNKEYALHLLHHCRGDINAAIILLMNPQPQVPHTLKEYKYPEKAKWTRPEINAFQEALLKQGKDFGQVAASVKTKNREDCVNFYHLWKKICSTEYEKVRSVWKKRDSAFTLELLKTVPPANGMEFRKKHNQKNLDSEDVKIKEGAMNLLNNVPMDLVHGLSFQSHEEYPCKICGKIFTKVKSRSAHMKSHRPPDQQPPPEHHSPTASIMNPPQKKTKIGLPIMTTNITNNNNSPLAKSFYTSQTVAQGKSLPRLVESEVKTSVTENSKDT